MSRTANPPYRRSMQRWWQRDPFFVRYMVREVTAVAVLVYAVVLAVGLLRLSQGQAAFEGYVAALRSPLSIVLHLLLLWGMVVHAKSWFEIMPKTMPLILPSGERIKPATITNTGWMAAAAATVVLLGLAAWWAA